MNDGQTDSGSGEATEEALPSNGFPLNPIPLSPEVQRFSPEASQAPIPTETQLIDDRAKRYKPIANKITKLLDSAGVRIVERKARNVGFNAEQQEAFGNAARMESETRELIADSTSRIAARYVKDERSMEVVALTSGLADWMLGLQAAVREIANSAPKQVQPSP